MDVNHAAIIRKDLFICHGLESLSMFVEKNEDDDDEENTEETLRWWYSHAPNRTFPSINKTQSRVQPSSYPADTLNVL